MQSDPVQFSTFGHMEETVPQECLPKSFCCSKCTLIFKSKVYLFEHLNKVHCLDIDVCLRDAGLKYAESKKVNTEKSRSAGKSFTCRNCDFKTCSRDVLTKHETQCGQTESPNLNETITTPVTTSNQHDEAEEASSSKDLRIYKRPSSQTITKYFTATSGSNVKLKLASDTKNPFSLEETPQIDVSFRPSDVFKHADHLYHSKRGGSDSQAEQTNMLNSEVGRKTSNESLKAPASKKPKLEEEATENKTSKPSGSTQFSFEVSDEEEERKAKLVDRDPPHPKVYFCKHCDYSNVSSGLVSSHYASDHPYVRCNAGYIQQSSDQSATFRCLECPVEFPSTVDLKWHYTEKHPETPDVFKMKLNELKLEFKCFTCTFTCSEVKDLRHHYKQNHLTWEVDNSLLFCQYLVKECQKTCEQTSSPKKAVTLSPDRTSTLHKEVKITLSRHPPTSTGPDAALYKCIKCQFEHKSAVAMQVHYQKKHPEKLVSLDEIKQFAREMTPEKKNLQKEKSTVPIKEKDTTPKVSKGSPEHLKIENVKSLADYATKGSSPSKHIRKTTDETASSQKVKLKPAPSLPKDGKLSQSELPSKATLKTPEISIPKSVKSSKKESTTKMSLSKPNTETTKSKSDKFLCSSPLNMHYCQFCSYASPQIRSVIGHHNAKHAAQMLLSKEDIIQYSAEVIENKNPITFKTSSHVKNSSEPKAQIRKTEVSVHVDQLYFCHLCNLGNPSTQGIIAHQIKVHQYKHSSRKSVLKYSALVREKIEKNGLYSSKLPLPIIKEEDKEMFFCHYCNYKHRSLTEVAHHFSRIHCQPFNKTDIRQYTSKVLEQLQKSPLKSAANLEKPEGKKEATNMSSKTFSNSVINPETHRRLPCKYCTFTTQYVFLLMSHMRKIHFSKLSVAAVLRLCFRKGALESGYHCEWCVFSHKKAEVVHKHYQDRHPGCKQMSLATVKARLFVGIKELHSKEEKTELKSVSQGQTSQSSQKDQDRPYHCTLCTFKSNAKRYLTRHCNKFHPLLVKDSPSDKGKREKSELDDLNEMPGLFESFQVPLEDTDEETSSSDVIKCPSCPATFHSKRGLSVHTGIKHLNSRNVKKQPKQIEGHMHVYKCPYCSYFNTSHQGVLTHCQMRHPVSTSRADSLYLDMARLLDCDDFTKGNSSDEVSKFSGYMCKTCPQICATLNKLKRHREQDHNETTSDMPKPASSTPKLSLRINLAKPNRTLKSVSKTSLHTKKVYIKIKCPQCPYVCSTNLGLNSHMLKQHNNAAPKDGIHKCMLCSQTYPFKRRLAKHYVRTHGKGAFQKYYIPLYKPFQKKKESSSEQEQNNSEKQLIFKCPTCPYVNTSYHGTLTHCQMKHPSVTVRADELETGEILLSNIVRCSKGKGSYKRGYMCKSCPEIHSSIKKLINHSRNEHGKAAVSELLSEAEKPDDNEDKAEETSVQLQREDGKAAPLKIVLKKDSSYKCELCPYSALTRKNLQCHYKYFHKLDALSTYKKLEKYNKRKNNFPFRYIELKKQLNLICKKCPNSVFASSQLLIEHYNNFHHLRRKSDFTVVSFGVRKKSTGLYKCNFCRKNLHGIRYLTRHLDRHRDQMKVEASQKKLCFASGTANPPSPKESQEKKNLPTFETIVELSHWTGAPVEVVTLPSSPPPSSSKVPDVDPEAEAQEAGHPCKRCQRTFMSLKGLRSHERSHAALGAIKKLDNLINTEFKNNIKKYLLHKPETLKPYRCGCCAYRTNFMVLWQSHFLKNHQDIIEQEIIETSTKDEEISQSSDKEVLNNLPELDEEPEDVEESTESYSEPPNVQRQLTHYSLMAQNVDKTNMNLHELSLSEGNLQCEMCNFNTEHLSSIRRHYANRHGKKILRCKDCEFYTGLRKNMEMHIETGHSTCQSKPTYLKDLRCPFCLYQTKNKNNMIDHIVLHREERVMPIEVRRPKLSRYLQGIVFRCHKCTFSSGSAENLRLHMMRHDDVKPYKCRLCYFDCTRLTDLEAHLSDKHQVLRNHELVGQVSLDQLEARTGSRPEANISHGSDSDELEAEEFTPDRDDIPQTDSIPDYHSTENMMFPMKEEHEPEEQEENGKTPANSSGSDIIQQNTSVLQRHEQDTQARDQNVAFHQPAKEQHEKNTEPKAEDCSDADIKYNDCRKNQTTLTDRQDEKVARRSLTSGKITDAKADGLHFTENHCKSQSIEAMVEDDIVCHVLRLDEDGSLHKPHKRAGQERTVKMEQTTEGNGADNEINDKVCSTSLAQNLKIQDIIVNPATTKMNSPQGNTSKLREGFRFEPHLLTLSPSQTRLKLAHRGSLGSLMVNFKREQSQSPKIIKDDSEPNREKAVLEECAKEEPRHLEQCEEEKEDEQMEKTDGEVEVKKNECKVQVSPHLHDDAFAPMDGAFDLLHDEKPFTCELCGRNLTNVSELNRHILRHGV